jgi:sugar/nucleoside kinase (ribokinase family)
VDAVVAGHLCLDIIPDLSALGTEKFDSAFRPGRLVGCGRATLATGGAVSNTGLALQTLGISTRLVARVGADQLGLVLRETLATRSPGLDECIIASADSSTSYSIVISPPGSDRRFLHHPGANDDFCAADVRREWLEDARIFHFGYPPLMAEMFARDGQQLTALFQTVKSAGLATSLDMAFPDPESAAGRANWPLILRHTLPYVDIFVPSFDEITYMLWHQVDVPVSAALLTRVSWELMEMGAKMVLLKLGDRGLYLHTCASEAGRQLPAAFPGDHDRWSGFEAWFPCFQVDVEGTTGSGDATVAGFLAAILHGLAPADALTAALAVGACNVEAADALSGIRSWEATQQRIRSGWTQRHEPEQFLRTS